MIAQLSGGLGQLGMARWAQAAPSSAWWLAGGINPADCVAAYQAKGAASYAASKVNLANPGTYDLTEGVAPNWDAASGWSMIGSKYFETGIYPTATMSAIVRFSGGNTTLNAGGLLLGSYSGNDTTRFTIAFNAGRQKRNYEHAGTVVIGTAVAEGTMAVTGQSGYYNGVFDATIPGTWSGIPTKTIHIGHLNGFTSFCTGYITAIAIYAVSITADQIMSLHISTGIL